MSGLWVSPTCTCRLRFNYIRYGLTGQGRVDISDIGVKHSQFNVYAGHFDQIDPENHFRLRFVMIISTIIFTIRPSKNHA